MPPINLLIKPASGNCNMNCDYCFYSDEMKNRQQPNLGIMSLETLEQVIKKALQTASGSCGITFQGGEPTLGGLDFYRQVVALEKKYNIHNVKIQNALQTNGYHLDKEWAEFFAAHHFLLGISIDGRKNSHDAYRHSKEGKDTFEEVMKTVSLWNQYKVDYNVLTVVNDKTVKQPRKIYELYQKNGWHYQQYIPCLAPISRDDPQKVKSYSPNAIEYGEFLNELFDCWYADLQKGQQPYIRQFENYVGILLGQPPDCCDQSGNCQIQYVVEADGSVYPCDFYAMDQYLLGNLVEDEFEELDEKRKQIAFIEHSLLVRKSCENCPYFMVCRGGCGRHWEKDEKGSNRNIFCESYQYFFKKNLTRLQRIANHVRMM